jgi:SAM-dependent methyltransferase
MRKANLGCGTDYKAGWVNVDISNKDIYGRKIKVDVVHDLNKYPWPFESEEFEKILIKGTIEHVRDLEKGVREIGRISKKGSIIIVNVPYFMSYFAYREINTHKFSLNAFQLFDIFRRNEMTLVSKRLLNNNRWLKWIERFVNSGSFSQNFYERFFSGIFPMNQVEWVFKTN